MRIQPSRVLCRCLLLLLAFGSAVAQGHPRGRFSDRRTHTGASASSSTHGTRHLDSAASKPTFSPPTLAP